MRAFRHRDFRLFWLGAFIAFCGSWIQNVAAGWLVFELTGSEQKLAFITFCSALPVALLGPIAGTMADTLNKRSVLVGAQICFSLGAAFYFLATYFGFIQYWHFLVVALILGTVSTIEMPTRQSVVSRVVPVADLPSAIPLTGMTFNLARVVGPAIGGILLASIGPQACFATNAITYLALIFAILTLRSDLTATEREPQPIKDLLFEGIRYTFAETRLRTLFIMEAVVAIFGLFYIALMPAIAKKMLGLDSKGLGLAMTVVGLGAITALITLASMKDRPIRATLVRGAMAAIGIALIILGSTTNLWIAFPVLVLLGMATITQFNTTNTLFQLLSPERLRGRVLAMHIWALSGLSPIGLLIFGAVADHVPGPVVREAVGPAVVLSTTPGMGVLTTALPGCFVAQTGLPLALKIGGACVLAGAVWAWLYRKGLEGVP